MREKEGEEKGDRNREDTLPKLTRWWTCSTAEISEIPTEESGGAEGDSGRR
jgi:hypothetical protein